MVLWLITELEKELSRFESERRFRELVMKRHLAMLDAERKRRNENLFMILSTGALIWAFMLLIGITIVMFIPLFK